MELILGQLGRSSLYFLVGYVTVVTGFTLAASARTPVYSGIVKAVLSAPFPSAVLGAPLVFMVGIVVHLLRSGVQRHVLRQSAYRLSGLPDTERASLRAAVSEALPPGLVSKDIEYPGEFELIQARLDPEFTPYSAHARWLYDLLADIVPIALFAIAVEASRAIAFTLMGLDWAVLTLAAVVILVAALAIPLLRAEFTSRDVALFVLRHQLEKEGEGSSERAIRDEGAI